MADAKPTRDKEKVIARVRSNKVKVWSELKRGTKAWETVPPEWRDKAVAAIWAEDWDAGFVERWYLRPNGWWVLDLNAYRTEGAHAIRGNGWDKFMVLEGMAVAAKLARKSRGVVALAEPDPRPPQEIDLTGVMRWTLRRMRKETQTEWDTDTFRNLEKIVDVEVEGWLEDGPREVVAAKVIELRKTLPPGERLTMQPARVEIPWELDPVCVRMSQVPRSKVEKMQRAMIKDADEKARSQRHRQAQEEAKKELRRRRRAAMKGWRIRRSKVKKMRVMRTG